MDKQKQIEEMARDLCNRYSEVTERCRIDHYGCNYTCGYYDNAKTLYDKGYRKIPENAVVLTREEYETYTFIKRKWGNQDAIKWSELVDGLYEFAREFSKETAEKFAEMLKEYAIYSKRNGATYYSIEVAELDEIVKEIIGEME